jgi:choline dehydrogenase-like flavoprotein
MKFLLFHVRVATFLSKKLIKVIDTLSQRERYAVYIKAEEKAFSNSTVSLSNYSDNTLTYSHKVSNNTFFLLQESIRVFREIFLNNFKAKLKINRLINNLSSIQYVFGANWHPMGTTRMGLDPKTSVCDANLKVHNVDNLYLLSAAVFPSGSNTNPTMTVLALANRLSENEFSKLN